MNIDIKKCIGEDLQLSTIKFDLLKSYFSIRMHVTVSIVEAIQSGMHSTDIAQLEQISRKIDATIHAITNRPNTAT